MLLLLFEEEEDEEDDEELLLEPSSSPPCLAIASAITAKCGNLHRNAANHLEQNRCPTT